MYREIWNWEKCKDKIRMLRGRLGFPDSAVLRFLKLTLSLESGQMHDELKDTTYINTAPVYCILSTYADARSAPETRQLISFRQLSGGQAYCNAFLRRAVLPLEKTFGSDPQTLYEAARLLDAEKLDYGDCSVKVRSLPLVPIIIILRGATSEFSASANILFDSSASNYLFTEQLAMLSELTSARLKQAYEIVKA